MDGTNDAELGASDGLVSPEVPAGVLGAGFLGSFPRDANGVIQGKRNIALLRQAAANGWGVTDAEKAYVKREVLKIIGGKPRNTIAAAKTIAAFDLIDAKREEATRKQEAPTVTVNLGVGVQIVQREDFYGNEAHESADGPDRLSDGGGATSHPTEAAETSGEDPIEPGAV